MTRPLIGFPIVHLAEVASTMEELAARAAAGAPEGTVVVAEVQNAGRGRAGRTWQAPPGSSILCSILLRPQLAVERLTTLPLMTGVAVAEAVEAATGRSCQVKWPNDIWLGGRKVAGILLQSRAQGGGPVSVIVGIGLNVNTAAADLPEGATSLFADTGRRYDRTVLLADLLARLDAAYEVFTEADGRPDLAAWRQRAALVGNRVAVTIAEQQRVGILRGVSDDGALLLETAPGRIVRVVAGDLVRGPHSLGDGEPSRPRQAGS